MRFRHDSGLVGVPEVARLLGVSQSHVRSLADKGILPMTRTKGGHRRFDPVAAQRAWENYLPTRHKVRQERIFERRHLDGADEAQVWEDIRPRLHLPDTALSVAHYVTTEMVNNAVDHSGGSTLEITVTPSANEVEFVVSDDGEGAFAHLARGLGLAETHEALGELTKGKRTTDPSRHTGEGIFFSSKATQVFKLEANGLRITFDNTRNDVAYGESLVRTGTVVTYTIDAHTTLGLQALFERFTNESFAFARSAPRVKLFELGVRFVSRSEAKRLGSGLEQFDEVELDFTGVTDVGQGFADELFRVWTAAHPDTVLTTIGMNDAVEFMVRRSRAAKS